MKRLYRQTVIFLLRHQYFTLGIIIILALGVRFARLTELCYVGKDEVFYAKVAEYWAKNDTIKTEDAHYMSGHPPLYIYIVSRLVKLGADPLTAGRGVNIASMPIFILGIFFAALTLFESRKTALICAFFAGLAPETARYSVFALREAWALAFYVCSIAFALKAMKDNRVQLWGWAGFFVMSGAMFRFSCLELFVIYPLAIALIWFYDRKFKAVSSIAAVYGGAAVSLVMVMLILGLDLSFYTDAYGARIGEKILYILRI